MGVPAENFLTRIVAGTKKPPFEGFRQEQKYHRSGGGAVVETGHDRVKRSAGDQLSSPVAGRTAHTRKGIVGHGINCAEKVSAGTGIKTSASTRECRWRE